MISDYIGRQFGNYRIVRKLALGSFGAVYLAEHLHLETLAAIKILHMSTELDARMRDKFLYEARVSALLQHPHIIHIIDFGFDEKVPYMVMDYMPNGTLRMLHPRGTCVPEEQIISYVNQIASALSYAHEQRVIHRDIKPENILLNSKQELVLSDFGIAVVQPTPDTLSTQSRSGTPVYMAPEQIQGKPCRASDQYALGVMVYEWLCGEPPFRGPSITVFAQHLHSPPPGLCARLPHLLPAVEDTVLGALAKRPQQRFSSVQDFAKVLEEAFCATQLLSLGESVERKIQDEITCPLHRVRLVPMTNESVPADDASTEPRLKTIRPDILQPNHRPVTEWVHPDAAFDASVQEIPRIVGRPITSPLRQLQAPATALRNQNRLRLLKRVRSFWITGVLEHSLHGAALMALGLQKQLDAITNPWHLIVQRPQSAPQPLPTGTRIVQVYDASDGELLILGAPGSGKTTLLLELARDLLQRAERDEHHPMPVVFNLSSWSLKQQRLTTWLVDELNGRYQVPRKLGQALVDADQILPLLDGLDEVAPKSRTACIEAINNYRQEHGFLPLVVCSRITDYLEQGTRVLLRCAVAVQPLTEAQVNTYLASGGEPLRALQVALRQDAALRELTKSPLMLSILTLTYYDKPVEEELQRVSPTDRQQQVLEHYIEDVLKRRGTATSYPFRHTIEWLTWLAQQMKRHSQTVFYIERMQPDWLPASWLHRLYYRVLVRLGIGIVSGLTTYLILGIAIGLFMGTSRGLRSGFVSGLIGGLVSGLAGGLVMALTSRIEKEIRPAEAVVWSWRKLVQVRSCKSKLIVWISVGLTLGLLMGMALVGLGSSGVKALIVLKVVLPLTLVVVAIIMLAGGLTSGVSTTLQNERDLILPNQGIRQSVRNSIRIGIMSSFVGGSISIGAFFLIISLIGTIFPAGPVNELCFLLLCGAVGGTISGLIVGLPNGGIASIQHLVLRVLLWRSHLMPWNCSRFLDYAAERILLSKVGGGYIFIHRLLLDHFVSREATLPTDEALNSSQIHPDKL